MLVKKGFGLLLFRAGHWMKLIHFLSIFLCFLTNAQQFSTFAARPPSPNPTSTTLLGIHTYYLCLRYLSIGQAM
jgi:hypothetical protein